MGRNFLGNLFDGLANKVSWLDTSVFGTRDIQHVRGNWYRHPNSGEFCVPMMLGAPFCPDVNGFEAELVYVRTNKPANANVIDPAKMFDHILANQPFVDAPIRLARGLPQAVQAIKHMNAELESRGYQRVSDNQVKFNMAGITNTSDPMYRTAMYDTGTVTVHTAKKIKGAEPSHIVARVVSQNQVSA